MRCTKVAEQLWKSCVVLSLAIAVAACATQAKLVPVNNSTPGTNVGWATVPPPKGSAWYAVNSPKGSAIYVKKLESSKHTFVATVITRRVSDCCADSDELLARARAIQEENRQDKRHRFITQEAEITSWDGFACVSHRIVAIDQGSPNFPGEKLNFFQKGITCLRPGSSGEVIDLTYSERNGPPEGSPTLVAEGESFLKGLKRP